MLGNLKEQIITGALLGILLVKKVLKVSRLIATELSCSTKKDLGGTKIHGGRLGGHRYFLKDFKEDISNEEFRSLLRRSKNYYRRH